MDTKDLDYLLKNSNHQLVNINESLYKKDSTWNICFSIERRLDLKSHHATMKMKLSSNIEIQMLVRTLQRLLIKNLQSLVFILATTCITATKSNNFGLVLQIIERHLEKLVHDKITPICMETYIHNKFDS